MANPITPSVSVTCSALSFQWPDGTSVFDACQGALVIAGHDLSFLGSVGITRWLLLGDELQETTAEEVRDLLEASEAG
ncbi:hypothetical protein ABZS86_12950 [Streptomyces sp. NPDC005355]|uniref:hypothetical protein n=1 Tax=Streptomyces sp. NPDC005355 TaxID=3157038 RepID=UPI0033AD0430